MQFHAQHFKFVWIAISISDNRAEPSGTHVSNTLFESSSSYLLTERAINARKMTYSIGGYTYGIPWNDVNWKRMWKTFPKDSQNAWQVFFLLLLEEAWNIHKQMSRNVWNAVLFEGTMHLLGQMLRLPWNVTSIMYNTNRGIYRGKWNARCTMHSRCSARSMNRNSSISRFPILSSNFSTFSFDNSIARNNNRK